MSDPGAARADSAPPALGAPYGWYLAGGSSWFLAWGMQHVMFAWLVVGELQLDVARVGTAQMTQMLPSLVFLIVGGSLADRVERRRALIALHAATAAVVLGLSWVVQSGALSFAVVLLYAVAWGTLQAIQLPIRDALLFDVGKSALPRAVSGATFSQFLGQAAGNLVVGSAQWLGTVPVLQLQAGTLLAGAWPVSRLPRRSGRARRAPRESALQEIRSGFSVVARSERLWPLAMLISFNGLFFLGPFFVLLPILVRDVYAGGVGTLSVAMVMFPLGTAVASLWIVLRGSVGHRGRAHFLGQAGGALCVALLATTPPFYLVAALVFVWGLCGGLFLNMGRTLFQEAVPESHRGRALAVYALALLGTAPLGQQGVGLLGEWLSAAAACAIAGGTMLLLLAVSWVLTPVRSFR